MESGGNGDRFGAAFPGLVNDRHPAIAKRMTAVSLFKDTRIKVQEAFAERELLHAFETSHRRHLVNDDDEDLVVSGDEEDLIAVNSVVRLIWAESVCRHLR